MERIAIIDHATHQLYIEDVSEEDLEKYDGDEQSYILDNYTFEGDISWDYITDIIRYTEENKDGLSVNLET